VDSASVERINHRVSIARRDQGLLDSFADFDDDGYKDLRDVGAFANCFEQGGNLSEECQHADWERDGVIGGREIEELGSRLTGPE
jgi:hypothetical protein